MTQNDDYGLAAFQKNQYEIVFHDPESILKKQLGDDVSVVNFESESFSKIGDNYGSTMMKISINIKRKNEDKVEELQLIGKLLPPTDFQRTLFDSNYTFRKEIFFYERLIPIYQKIWKEKFEIVPRYYGSRISFDSETGKINEDAVLLLENLKVKGYYMQDRHKGLDLEHLKVVIPSLAKFHAIGLALKYKNLSFLPILDEYRRPLPQNEINQKGIAKFIDDIEKHQQLNQYYYQTKPLLEKAKAAPNIMKLDDPWACVAHADLWNNNIIFHRNDAGKVDDAKFVDFQTYTVTSPLVDLLFLLCTSMEYPLEHFYTIVELYRQSVYNILKELDVDPRLFEKQPFEERLKIDAAADFYHIILMINVVECHENEDFIRDPPNEFTVRRWKRVFQIFEQNKWF